MVAALLCSARDRRTHSASARRDGRAWYFTGIGDLPAAADQQCGARCDALRRNDYAVGAFDGELLGTTPNLDTARVVDVGRQRQWKRSRRCLTSPGQHNTQDTARSAYAITPDGAFHREPGAADQSTGTRWVRVTRSLLPEHHGESESECRARDASAFAALAIADDGGVVYGQQTSGTGAFRPRRVSRALRTRRPARSTSPT